MKIYVTLFSSNDYAYILEDAFTSKEECMERIADLKRGHRYGSYELQEVIVNL